MHIILIDKKLVKIPKPRVILSEMPYTLVTHGDNYCQQHYSPECLLQKQMDPLKPEARTWARQPPWAAAASQLWGFQTWGLRKPSLANTRLGKEKLYLRATVNSGLATKREGSVKREHWRAATVQAKAPSYWQASPLQSGRSMHIIGDRKKTKGNRCIQVKGCSPQTSEVLGLSLSLQ